MRFDRLLSGCVLLAMIWPECTPAQARQSSPLERAISAAPIGPDNEPSENVSRLRHLLSSYPKSDPFESQALLLLGKAEYKAEEFDAAQATMGKAMESLPKGKMYMKAATTRVESLGRLGRHKEAAAVAGILVDAAEKSENGEQVEYGLRRRYEELATLASDSKSSSDLAEASRAVGAYQTFAEEIDSQGRLVASAVYRQARMLIAAGETNAAAAALGKFLVKHPSSDFAAEMAVDKVMLDKHLTLATLKSSDVLWIPERYPCNSATGMAVLFEIATLLRRDGKTRQAAGFAERVLDFQRQAPRYNDPTTQRLQVNASRLLFLSYRDLGERQRAIKAAQDAIERFPQSDIVLEARSLLTSYGVALPTNEPPKDRSWLAMLAYGGGAALVIAAAVIILSRKQALPNT